MLKLGGSAASALAIAGRPAKGVRRAAEIFQRVVYPKSATTSPSSASRGFLEQVVSHGYRLPRRRVHRQRRRPRGKRIQPASTAASWASVTSPPRRSRPASSGEFGLRRDGGAGAVDLDGKTLVGSSRSRFPPNAATDSSSPRRRTGAAAKTAPVHVSSSPSRLASALQPVPPRASLTAVRVRSMRPAAERAPPQTDEAAGVRARRRRSRPAGVLDAGGDAGASVHLRGEGDQGLAQSSDVGGRRRSRSRAATRVRADGARPHQLRSAIGWSGARSRRSRTTTDATCSTRHRGARSRLSADSAVGKGSAPPQAGTSYR